MEVAQYSTIEPVAEVSKGHVPPPLWIRKVIKLCSVTNYYSILIFYCQPKFYKTLYRFVLLV